MKKIFIAIIVLIVVALLFITRETTQLSTSLFSFAPDSITVCAENDGTWNAEYQECEYINAEVCTENKGVFEECTSACRHDAKAENCTLQCVPVCSFKDENPKNIPYTIETDTFFLDNRIASDPLTKETVQLMRMDRISDLNDDRQRDYITLLTHTGDDGSERSYASLALSVGKGYKSTNAVLLGDQVTLQSAKRTGDEIIVNYTARYPWETIEDVPSVSKSKHLVLENGVLTPVQPPELSQLEVRLLAIEKWGDCEDERCTALSVDILDGKDGVWYLDAFYDGIADDSVSNERHIAIVEHVRGEWRLGKEVKKEFKCHEGRGQKEYAEALCL